jgi:flagellar biogenesis protein FliO
MNSLFGVELPTPVTFVIAFVVVLALIGIVAWLVRRFGAARLAAGRGRQPRLAVIDAASIDGRRKLIIIRRDNVEHLLMIGGPTDVVVETNIVRAGAASQREAPVARSAESLPRAATLPEAPNWPQPEPPIAPRADRPRLVAEEPAPLPAAATPAPSPPSPPPPPLRVAPEPLRPAASADPLLGLAAELSRAKPEVAARPPEPPRIPLTAGQGNGDAPIANPVVTPVAQATTKPIVTPITAATPAAATAGPTAPLTPDAHLAEMAQRLENALRRPLASQAVRRDAGSPPVEANRPESKTLQFPELKPGAAGNSPTQGKSGNGAPARSVYEDLEQEMASLLGRQSGKS